MKRHRMAWRRAIRSAVEGCVENSLLIGLKGRTKPFAIVESREVWVDETSGSPRRRRFNHYDDWAAWPANMRGRKWPNDPQNKYREGGYL